MDFTLKQYYQLLKCLKNAGYFSQSLSQFIEIPLPKLVILRHDVDNLPQNSLQFARIQEEHGIKGTYYFRIVPESFDEKIIREIASLGHEIGYHYETMDTCKGDVDKAYDEFCRNLEIFRKIVPISTICMHGSPRSPYDNRDIWKKYNYHDLGISGEPYFDLDFNKIAYFTDTGRRWDGMKIIIRDKPTQQLTTQWPSYNSTNDIIKAIKEGTFPGISMINFHPQRWSNNIYDWTKELILQNMKNVVKRLFFFNKK